MRGWWGAGFIFPIREASVNPDAVDEWNGSDDDCDGYDDNPDVDDVATAEITGSTSAYLTAPWGLGSGDYTGDGRDDLVIGAAYSASYSGTAWLIEGSDVIGASGDVSSIDSATINGERYSYAGILSPTGQDLTGDGTADLVVQGSPYAMYGGYAGNFYEGGSSLSGILDTDDAYATLDSGGDYGYGTVRSLSNLDFDGDGIGELVRADGYYGSSGMVYYTGRVEIYDVYGATGALTDEDDAYGMLSGTENNGQVGTSVGGGDLDGDGHDELVIGAPGVAGAATGGGVVYIVNGDDVDQEADVDDVGSILYGATSNAFVGRGGIVVGDLDASGGLDLAIGAPGADEVYIFLDANGLPDEAETSDADTTLTGSDSFGFALTIQDSDHDGRNDLVVGAPAISPTYEASYAWFMAAGTDIGQVHMFDRSVLTAGGSQPSTLAFRGLSAPASGDLFGSVLASGDFDDDGVDDLAVGAPATNGRAYVVLGNQARPGGCRAPRAPGTGCSGRRRLPSPPAARPPGARPRRGALRPGDPRPRDRGRYQDTITWPSPVRTPAAKDGAVSVPVHEEPPPAPPPPQQPPAAPPPP